MPVTEAPTLQEIEASEGLKPYCDITSDNRHALESLAEGYGFFCRACGNSISAKLYIQVADGYPVEFARQDDATVKEWAENRIRHIEAKEGGR